MTDRWTKTDLRRLPRAPRDAAALPAPTGEEEHALLFGEITAETKTSHVQPSTEPDADATAD